MEKYLRPPSREDIDCYHEIFSDELTHHFIIDEGLQSLDGSKKKLETLIAINGESKKVYTIINNEESVGFIVVHLDGTDSPFASYAIKRSSQKKGFASKAISELVDIENGNYRHFKAATHIDNKASQKLLRKNGFTEVGVRQFEKGKRLLFEYSF